MRVQEKWAGVALVDLLMPWKGERETIAWFRELPVKISRCGCKEGKASIGLVTDWMWREGRGRSREQLRLWA